jgi:hypothetical protein
MPDAVSSALSVVLDDAEKLADNLVPPGSSVEKVLGVLVLQVEKALGGKIESLTDKALGIGEDDATPSPTATTKFVEPPAPSTSADPADLTPAELESAKAAKIAAAKTALEEAENS